MLMHLNSQSSLMAPASIAEKVPVTRLKTGFKILWSELKSCVPGSCSHGKKIKKTELMMTDTTDCLPRYSPHTVG
jgi:hypothetical protein